VPPFLGKVVNKEHGYILGQVADITIPVRKRKIMPIVT
jgi:sporulation protein YlmC with PRC-barrel domain